MSDKDANFQGRYFVLNIDLGVPQPEIIKQPAAKPVTKTLTPDEEKTDDLNDLSDLLSGAPPVKTAPVTAPVAGDLQAQFAAMDNNKDLQFKKWRDNELRGDLALTPKEIQKFKETRELPKFYVEYLQSKPSLSVQEKQLLQLANQSVPVQQTGNNDIQQKKADIEKRRQEELKNAPLKSIEDVKIPSGYETINVEANQRLTESERYNFKAHFYADILGKIKTIASFVEAGKNNDPIPQGFEPWKKRAEDTLKRLNSAFTNQINSYVKYNKLNADTDKIIRDLSEGFKDTGKINAKYDAELAALENKPVQPDRVKALEAQYGSLSEIAKYDMAIKAEKDDEEGRKEKAILLQKKIAHMEEIDQANKKPATTLVTTRDMDAEFNDLNDLNELYSRVTPQEMDRLIGITPENWKTVENWFANKLPQCSYPTGKDLTPYYGWRLCLG
jgi:hypothetical protein